MITFLTTVQINSSLTRPPKKKKKKMFHDVVLHGVTSGLVREAHTHTHTHALHPTLMTSCLDVLSLSVSSRIRLIISVSQVICLLVPLFFFSPPRRFMLQPLHTILVKCIFMSWQNRNTCNAGVSYFFWNIYHKRGLLLNPFNEGLRFISRNPS